MKYTPATAHKNVTPSTSSYFANSRVPQKILVNKKQSRFLQDATAHASLSSEGSEKALKKQFVGKTTPINQKLVVVPPAARESGSS